jgi:O-antigen/teichoic acid export membrane protein
VTTSVDPPGSTAGRRLTTITVDQVVSGASNLGVSVLAAHALGLRAFGLWELTFLVFVLVQSVSRALVCEPVLVHPQEADERPGDVIGTAVVLGLGQGMLIGAAGCAALWWDGGLGRALLVLAVCMPLLVIQDLGRYLAFVRHEPARALTLDLAWLGLVVLAMAVVLGTDHATLGWFALAWAGSGAGAGLLTLHHHRASPWRFDLGWLRETWHLTRRYLVSGVFGTGGALAVVLVVAGMAGAAALGAVRGAQLLTRPFVTIYIAATSAGVSELSRIDPGSSDYARHVRRTTTVSTAMALVILVVLVLLPDAVGKLAIGDVWTAAEPLVLPATVQLVFVALASGTRAGLLGRRALPTVMRLDICTGLILIAAIAVGLVVGDIRTAYWFLALGQGVCTGIWWLVYARQRRGPAPDLTARLRANSRTGA